MQRTEQTSLAHNTESPIQQAISSMENIILLSMPCSKWIYIKKFYMLSPRHAGKL